jgi:hypothetical protein
MYIVINLCDSMQSFSVEANLSRFFIICLCSICIAVGEPIIKRVFDWNPIKRFTPATFKREPEFLT